MTAFDPRLLTACRRALDDPDARVGDLAAAAGMSAGHFQRAFKQALGVTPGEFLRAGRLERFRAALNETESVTAAIHAAGFGSTSRAHQASGEGLGMPPSRARSGAAGERIEYATVPCRLGRVLVAATPRGLCAVLLGDADDELHAQLRERVPNADLRRAGDDFRGTLAAVVALIDAPADLPADLPLDIAGTAFQRRAWKALQQIPAGEQVTYAELARRMGHPSAHRAAAAACGANPLAVVIPCHRVVRADGGLGGYRWGLERKRALLEGERAAQEKASTPRPDRDQTSRFSSRSKENGSDFA